MYTLGKHDTGHIAFKYNKNMDFNIGFESIAHVRHVQYNINPVKYNLRLKLSHKHENRQGYKTSVVRLSDYAKIGKDVFIDTAAILTIEKKNIKQLTYQRAAAKELTYMIQLEKVNEEEFVMRPIVSSTNIVLPKSIRHENNNSIAFDSIAIYAKPESIEELKMRLSENF